MEWKIFYSSITGNTRRAAEYAKRLLEEEGYQAECLPADSGEVPAEDSGILLFFWCRRSSLDDISLRLLQKLEGRRVLAIGTIGGAADGKYGERVAANVRKEIEKNNFCEGVYILQGAVDLKRIRKRRELDPKDPHYVSDEKYERYLQNQGRPDGKDLEALGRFLKREIKKLKKGVDKSRKKS